MKEPGQSLHSPWLTSDGPTPGLGGKSDPKGLIPAVKLNKNPEQ